MIPFLHMIGELLQACVDFVYPPLCLLCNTYLPAEVELVCQPCFRRLARLEDPDLPGPVLRLPLRHPPHFERSVALYEYTDSVQVLIHFFKYHGGRSLALPFGEALGQMLVDGGHAARALIPVPLHPARQRERGYNQSFLLAAAMSRVCAIPVWTDVLWRRKATLPQARMGREQRLRNLNGAFAVKDGTHLANGIFVLVDDVLTTGHTLDRCAYILLDHGAEKVVAATIARVI